MAVLPSFFLRKWQRVLLSLLFLFSLFGYRTFKSTQLLPYGVSLTLASCMDLKVRYEEIVKAICQGGYIMRNRFDEMQLGECESICECIKDKSNGEINLIIDENEHGFILKNGDNELNSMLDLETLYQIILTFQCYVYCS